MPFFDPDELDADFYSNRATGLKSLMLQSGYLTHHPAGDGQPARLGLAQSGSRADGAEGPGAYPCRP